MMVQRLIALFFLFILIDANPILESMRENQHRQRRSLHFMDLPLVDKLYKHFFKSDNHQFEERRNKRSELPIELRPVEGPINIEQLPAMLASRYVKRYPFSQQDDPAIIGR